MNADTVVDIKGRILIPKDIREKLDLKPGVKLLFRVENGKLTMLKATTPEEFQSEVDEFGKKLKNIKADPITVEKIF